MNRFNKIMLLGLLSIVTGATSVKGMNTQQLVTYDKIMTEVVIPDTLIVDDLGVDDLAKFNTFNEEEKTKIATLYVCVQIRNGADISSLVSNSGEVTLNGQQVQLSEEQEVSVRSYFNKIAALKAGQPTSGTQPQKSGLSTKKKIAIATAATIALAATYIALGNMYYDANCTGVNTSFQRGDLSCLATEPAKVAAAYAFAKLAAAGTGLATAGTAITTLAQKLYAKAKERFGSAQPTCPLSDKPVATQPTCSLSDNCTRQVIKHYEYCLDQDGHVVTGKLLTVEPANGITATSGSSLWTQAGTGLTTAGASIKTLARKLYAKAFGNPSESEIDRGYCCQDYRTEIEDLNHCQPPVEATPVTTDHYQYCLDNAGHVVTGELLPVQPANGIPMPAATVVASGPSLWAAQAAQPFVNLKNNVLWLLGQSR